MYSKNLNYYNENTKDLLEAQDKTKDLSTNHLVKIINKEKKINRIKNKLKNENKADIQRKIQYNNYLTNKDEKSEDKNEIKAENIQVSRFKNNSENVSLNINKKNKCTCNCIIM